MSDRVITVLLSLSLILQNVCTEFQVWTLVQKSVQDPNSVHIICQHNASQEWTVNANLLIDGNNECDNTTCDRRKEGNWFHFTVKISAKSKRYRCKVYREDPIPIIVREGEELTLDPGCDFPPAIPTNSCNCLDMPRYDCPCASLYPILPIWTLLGIAFLLCLYSFIITVVYIKLRRKVSEELTITYVPMQKNGVGPKRKVKGHGADKNAEYMDMRRVHHQAQPITDMNHNSRLNPVGSSV